MRPTILAALLFAACPVAADPGIDFHQVAVDEIVRSLPDGTFTADAYRTEAFEDADIRTERMVVCVLVERTDPDGRGYGVTTLRWATLMFWPEVGRAVDALMAGGERAPFDPEGHTMQRLDDFWHPGCHDAEWVSVYDDVIAIRGM